MRRNAIGEYAFTAFAALVALLVLMPLLWMVSVSLMHPGAAAQFPPPLLPEQPTLDNYRTLFQDYGIDRYAFNSLLVSVLATFLALLFVVPAGYAFAKLRFGGRDAIFQALVAALVVPGQIGMLPLFLELKAMGLVNSYAGALVPWLAGIFGIFMVRQFCLGIPNELIEAARIDGAGEWRIFLRIIMPMCGPAVATLTILSFLASWNNFLWPLVVATKEDMYTLPVALALYSVGQNAARYGLMMAGAVVVVLPILLVFVFLQRYFVQGIALTGIK